jgi:hypothetical protein
VPPSLPCHCAIAALQPADNSALCSLMQACRASAFQRTAAHNLRTSSWHAARTAWGAAALAWDVIAGTRTTKSNAKRAMPNDHFALIRHISYFTRCKAECRSQFLLKVAQHLFDSFEGALWAAVSGQAAHTRRSAAHRGDHRQAAGACRRFPPPPSLIAF